MVMSLVAVQPVVAAGHVDLGEALPGAEGVEVSRSSMSTSRSMTGWLTSWHAQQRVVLALVDRHHERVGGAGGQRDVELAGAVVGAEPEVAVVVDQRELVVRRPCGSR